MKKSFVAGSLLAAVALVAASLPGEEKPAGQPDPQAVQRSRETVQLLDGVYKQAVVLITEKYVHKEDDFPAGSAAVELFRRIGEGGTHQVRLIDATGQPYEPKNVAQDDFERQGIKLLKEGKVYHDEVIIKEGRPYLRAITPVPVVMKKCVMCHSHYADAKEGEPIGALSYEFPIK